MAIDYTAMEVGGFSTTYYTALTVNTDGTTSTTENFTFQKVTGSTTDLVITKQGSALSVTVASDAAAAVDVTAYEYTLQGNTYVAVFYVKNDALHFSVYNDELEVVEADNVLTSTYTTIDGVHAIYSHENDGRFIVDASSTSGSSGNFSLNYQIVNSAPEFLSDVSGEALTTRPATFTAAEIGTDDDGDTVTISAVSVASGLGIYYIDDSGKVHVFYTGPALADGETADVVLNVTLADNTHGTNGTYTITFEGTGASTLDLSVEEAAELIDAGYDTLASLGGEITGITLIDTVEAITALTTEELDALATAGANVIDLTSSEASFTKAQADAFLDAGFSFASDDALSLADTGAVLGALTATEIETLAELGIDAVDATDDAWALDMEALDAFIENGIAFASGDTITLADTGAVLGTLTATQIASLAALGIDAVDATDDVLELDKAALDAFEDNGIALASGDSITLADAASVLNALTGTEIAALAALGVDAVDATDDVLELDKAALDAFEDNGIALADDDAVTLVDTGSALGALTETDIESLAALGVDAVDASDDVLELGRATFDAYRDNGIALAGGDAITLVDTAASFSALTATEIEALASFGIDTVDATDDVFNLDRATYDMFETNGIGFADTSALRIRYEGTGRNDKLDGTGYHDILVGLGKNDVLNGLAGDDELSGGDGADKLNGGAGNDVLRAGTGNDTLTGGKGDDLLSGGEGSDRLTGGAGADIFVFLQQTGKDVVTDFQDDDTIDLSGAGRFEKFADVKANSHADGHDLVLELGPGMEVILKDVSIKDLDRDNFIF